MVDRRIAAGADGGRDEKGGVGVMARSKRIDDAVRDVLISRGNTDGIMDACSHLASTLTDEILNSFCPYSTAEIPFLIFSLQSIYTELRERHPEAAKIADESAGFFSCVGTEVHFGEGGM